MCSSEIYWRSNIKTKMNRNLKTMTLNWSNINGWKRVMVLNATFNNISVISWPSVLLVEKTGVPGENHWLTYHIMLYRVHPPWAVFKLVNCRLDIHSFLCSIFIGPSWSWSYGSWIYNLNYLYNQYMKQLYSFYGKLVKVLISVSCEVFVYIHFWKVSASELATRWWLLPCVWACIICTVYRSYGSWIYNLSYLYNQYLSPLKLWVWIPLMVGVLDTTLCDKLVSGFLLSKKSSSGKYEMWVKYLSHLRIRSIYLIINYI
jgi:hypothetical protein